MATWTPESKSAEPTTEQVLEIGGGYVLNIGGGYNLIIQPENSGTVLVGRAKNDASWVGETKS